MKGASDRGALAALHLHDVEMSLHSTPNDQTALRVYVPSCLKCSWPVSATSTYVCTAVVFFVSEHANVVVC
jgi:hypothetical protein